ncbi:MAG: transketolase [Acidobacteriota bacterium]|nr:transketolase [Acidobacteriota bacterium]
MSDLNRDKSHRTAINTLRFLAVDMVEQANSGHPGAPMGLAPLAYLLWTRHLRHDPRHPDWPNRDRFVLSCGHASALIYGLLHLAGFDLPMEELKRFRQLGSKTPGHPEYGLTPGVETTTGPLGQGFATAVGMAMAREHLGARFNRPGHELFDHRVWVVASDGDLMEGVAAEAASLAGHQKLGCLKVFYDDNRITIDGGTDLTFTEDTAQRFEAYGWFVQTVADGRDLDALEAAAQAAAAEEERPSLVVVRTHIGYGSPNKQDTSKAHGSPLGEREVALTKDNLGWPQEPTFLVPDGVRESFEPAAASGAEARQGWLEQLESYRRDHPEAAAELDRRLAGELPEGWRDLLPRFAPEDGPIATRSASGKALSALVPSVQELVGGSADLAGSNNTTQPDEPFFSPEHREGRNHHFGVREHAMAAAANGMALSGLLTPYYGTFLIFSDYLRPALRLGALMGVHSVAVLTHDSIFLGEDGPTHQPISQLLSLRSIPRVTVLRPADANETAAAWAVALTRRQGPVVLALTRQKLPVLAQTASAAAEGVARGGYVLSEATAGEPRLLLLATGSEVELALGAQRALEQDGVATRVVSMPSWELFEAQPKTYRQQVLPPDVPLRLAVEAGSPMGWDRYVGPRGAVLGLDGFGESAPYKDLAEHFGFTVEAVAERARALLADD